MKTQPTKTRAPRKTKIDKGASLVLACFIDFAEQGEDALVAYLKHCGITLDDLRDAETPEKAILAHYLLVDGRYEIERVAYDLARWPPIAERIRELKCERRAEV